MELRDWIDLTGLTIKAIKLDDSFVRLVLSDESWIDVGADGAFDENGNHLTGTGDLPSA